MQIQQGDRINETRIQESCWICRRIANNLKTNLSVPVLLALHLGLGPVALAQDAFSRGLSQFQRMEYAEALKSFSEPLDTKAQKQKERESERLYYLALCYLHTGQNAKGRKCLDQVCRSFPASQAAKQALKYLKDEKKGLGASNSEAIANKDRSRSSSDEPEEFSIPFRKTAGGQLAVKTQINGHGVELIFDTGAEECLFGKNQISDANLASVERSKSALVHSVSGPIRVFQIRAELKLGSLKRNLAVCVQESSMKMGILGQPFLRGYSCYVDNRSGLIRLHKSDLNKSSPLDSFAIPFVENGEKLIVKVKLNGHETEMCFDTGAFGVCLSKPQSEKAGLKLADSSNSQTSGPSGTQVSSWETSADISLGPIVKNNCPVRVLDSSMSYPLLGQNFFGDRPYMIDRQKKEIIFSR